MLQRGREFERKERRETNREKSVGKEETRENVSERAIRVMHCVGERLFSNIVFRKTTYKK